MYITKDEYKHNGCLQFYSIFVMWYERIPENNRNLQRRKQIERKNGMEWMR